MSNKEKIIWVTGASSGIGKSTAIQFVKGGFQVAASSRNGEQLERIKTDLTEKGNLYEVYPMDISKYEQVDNTQILISEKSKIDCLINNAGVTSFTKASENKISDIQEIINTNLLGAIYAIKAVLPQMIANKKGTIINILSVVTQKIFTESSAYSASKAGLMAYVKVLREEVRNYNIRVINVIPGATRTPIWPNTALEKYSNRMMSPDDIAKFVFDLYLNNSTIIPEDIVLRPIKGDL